MVKVEENGNQLKKLQMKLLEALYIGHNNFSGNKSYISVIIALVAQDAKNISFSASFVEFTSKNGRKYLMNRETGEFLKPMEANTLELAKIREINRSKNGLVK